MNTKILKRILLIGAVFLVESQIKAQMYVSPDNFVFVNDAVVFIKQNLELKEDNSTFYLRNNAQLIQGSEVTGTNKGEGSLSVFQEGSSNNFQFNYWCSPVGGNNESEENSPFGIYQLKDIVDLTNSRNPIILAATNYDGTATPFSIAPHWINKLISTTAYSGWTPVGSNSVLNAGEGFTMKGTSGKNTIVVNGVENNPGNQQRYDFRGKPNDGTITIPVAYKQFTLTGNPYPSAIDLSVFLINEPNCTGIAYFWEEDKTVNSHYLANYKGGYGTYSPVGENGLYIAATYFTYDGNGNEVVNLGGSGRIFQRRYAPIGQGFMIKGVVNGNVEMKNVYWVFVKEGVANLSEFGKTTNRKSTFVAQTPQIRFNVLLDNGPMSQMILAFDPLSTQGVDHAMDALTPNSEPENVYFILNNDAYIINVMPFDIDKKIAIGFKNTAEANYKITINEIVNLPEVQNIFLHNKVTDAYYDIKNSFYELILPPGVANTQYEITFKNKALGVNEQISQNFIVSQNNSSKSLMINNPLQIELSSCALYDVAGKLVFNEKHLGTNLTYVFSTSGLRDGIYIVKIIANGKSEFGKKIIIQN